MTPKNLLEGSYPSAAVSSDRFLGLEGAIFEICTQFVPAKGAVGYNGWETKSRAGLHAICDLSMIGRAPGSPK